MNARMTCYLMSHPQAWMKFRATGQLPEVVEVTSPLIRFLESMPPRERVQWSGIGHLRDLGYDHPGGFQNASQLLHWLKPEDELIGNESSPAETRKIKSFSRTITREMFAACCERHPLQFPADKPAAP